MKKFLTPKIITLIGFIFSIGGVMLNIFDKDIIVFIGMVVLLWVSITIHELGHIIFGIKSGFKFDCFITGFIKIENTSNGIEFKENTNWSSIGGMTIMTPPLVSKEELLNKQIIYSLGGPVLSVLFFLISISLYYVYGHITLLYFSLVNGVIFLATIIPSGKGVMGSDGYFILSILKSSQEALNLAEDILVSRELLSNKKPNEWNLECIQFNQKKLENIDSIMYATMLYYYEIENNGFQHAKKVVNDLTKIPINNDNNKSLAIFIHMQQIECFLTSNASNNLSKIKNLQVFLTSVEPVSFYRGQAIINCLQQEQVQAIKNIQKVNKIITKNEHLYGFFQVEKKLTNLIEEKMYSLFSNHSKIE